MIFLFLTLVPFIGDVAIAAVFLRRDVKHGIVRYVLAFSSGIVISAAFFELLPEAGLASNSIFVAVGFFGFYLVEKLTLLHACGEEECELHGMGRISAIGMALDNVVDGIGIAVGYQISPLLGLLLAVAVVSHETPQALSSLFLLRRDGRSMKETAGVLTLAASMYPIGGLISTVIPEYLHSVILAIVAGAFLYIGAGDLMMESHRRFNIGVVLSVITGGLLMALLASTVG